MSSGIATPPSLPPLGRRHSRRRRNAKALSRTGCAAHAARFKGVDIAGGLLTLFIGVLVYLLADCGDRPLADLGRIGFLGKAAVLAGTDRRGGRLLRATPSAPDPASHQSDLRRRHDRKEPADVEEQPDQFSFAPRQASGSGRAGVSGVGASRRGRPLEGAHRIGGRSGARHPLGLRVGRRVGPVQPLCGPLAEESFPLGRAGPLAVVVRRGADARDDPRRRPEDAIAFLGETVTVSAEIKGLRKGEPAR